MIGHHILEIAHATEGLVDRVFGQRCARRVHRLEQMRAPAGDGVQPGEDRHGLR